MKNETTSRISARGLSLILGFISALGLAAASSAQAVISASHDSPAVVIPFRLYNGNLVVVKATVGAIRNVNMIVDTGTSPTAINKELAKRLKLSGESEPLETLNGTIQAQSLTLPEIDLGSFRATSLRVLVQDFTSMERDLGTSIGGIVGLDILSAGPFTIDYEKRNVIFGPATELRNEVPFASTVEFPIVRSAVNGQQLRLLLDSGTWELLVFRGRLHIAPNLDQVSSVSTAGGSTQLSWLRTHVTLGSNDLGAHKVAIAEADADPDFDGLLGFAGMGFHRVSFDFEKRLFSWE